MAAVASPTMGQVLQIGRLAETHYAFYGFQWESTEFVETAIVPMAAQMAREEVEAALLAPA